MAVSPTPPPITLLPAPPLPTDPESVFDTKAGASLAAQQAMVPEVNTALAWVAGALVDTKGYKDSAATSASNAYDSATLAGQKVGLAADQVALAVTQANNAAASASSAQVSAAAAGAAAGLPSLTSHSGDVLTVNTNELGVSWQKGLPPLAGNDGKTLQVAPGGLAPTWVILGLLHVVDEKPSGTSGGASVTGSYVTRDLNTVRSNSIPGASLAANKVILPAGTYRIRGVGGVGDPSIRNKARLVNDATGVVLSIGNSSAGTGTEVWASVTLSATATLRLEQRFSSANGSGLGAATSYGDVEVYSQLLVERVA